MPVYRKYAIASVELFDELQGDPVVSDHGYANYDLLSEIAEAGKYDYYNGLSKLEYIKDVGLVHRPFLVPKDTRLSQFTTTGGSWAERKPSEGVYKLYRLVQYDVTEGIDYYAESNLAFPESPTYAFSLILPDTPADWNTATHGDPFVQIQMGNGQWAIHFRKDGTYLLRDVDGEYQAVKELPSPSRGSGYSDIDEVFIFVRSWPGKLGISLDFGKVYTVFAPADPLDAVIQGGKVAFKGSGGGVAFGVHELELKTGSFIAPSRNAFQTRLFANLYVNGDYSGDVAFEDVSQPQNSLVQWKATLTPEQTGTNPFPVFSESALYSTFYRYPFTWFGPFQPLPSTPWDTYLTAVDISKPIDLDSSECTLRFDQSAWSLFTGNYFLRKIRVKLGYRLSDGTDEWYTAFTGYITTVDLRWDDEFSRVQVEVKAQNASITFKTTEWTKMDVYPLGGNTINAAADYVLASEGRDASYRTWHVLGEVIMPRGRPESRFELIKPFEKKWATLKRLFAYQGLEPVARDDGSFVSLPKNYVEPVVTKTFRSTPQSSTDIRDQMKAINHRIDYLQSGTAVIVYAFLENGEQMMVWAVDSAAEGNTFYGKSVPWRIVVQEELQGTCLPAMAVGKAVAMAQEHFSRKYEPSTTIPVDLRMTRRQRISIVGAPGVGIADGIEHAVMSLTHTYRVREGLSSLSTVAGLRRLNV